MGAAAVAARRQATAATIAPLASSRPVFHRSPDLDDPRFEWIELIEHLAIARLARQCSLWCSIADREHLAAHEHLDRTPERRSICPTVRHPVDRATSDECIH